MRNQTKFWIKLLTVIAVIVGLFIYGMFQAKNFILGPKIEIFTPTNGISTDDERLEITGKADRITYIEMNGRPIEVTPTGNFDEKLILIPGYNIININARDTFGRVVNRKIELILNQKNIINNTATTTQNNISTTTIISK